MNVLKIATAGSVDDGKSTLIGRLLYDTKSLTSDKIEAIEKTSKQKGYDYLDFSLATDGLVAEREQGITIDVAHIYFSTESKSYIIADTPGHIEYTRNMITGASTSQASIILIDARKGVVEQTNRHFFINNLLQIKEVIVAINKMDLVDFSEERYNEIVRDFRRLLDQRKFKDQQITFVPISALNGDNVVLKSLKMPWYKGRTVLAYLESLNFDNVSEQLSVRFPIQFVIRPKTDEFHDFRAYAGKIYGGNLNVGDEVVVLPSKTESKIKAIHFYNEQIQSAGIGSSVSVCLENDVNISRGDMLVRKNHLPSLLSDVDSIICWFDYTQFNIGNLYTLQHGVNRVLAKVTGIEHKINPDYSGVSPAPEGLKMNDIATVSFKLNRAIYADKFVENKSNGAFILIDNSSNNTVAVGFVN